MKLFECGIRYKKTMGNGTSKEVTELYIVDAITFTEAEARITVEIMPFMSGELAVVSEKITNYSEVVVCAAPLADKWYKVKANFIALDERTEKEKKTPKYYLVQAADLDDARNRFASFIDGSVSDIECESVAETRIMDVFLYENKPKQ